MMLNYDGQAKTNPELTLASTAKTNPTLTLASTAKTKPSIDGAIVALLVWFNLAWLLCLFGSA